MSKLTHIEWQVEYRIDRYKIGQRVEVIPVIETINGKPVSDFSPDIVRDVTETLWNDNCAFNDAVDQRKVE